jgi:signal transduction histidine kinase
MNLQEENKATLPKQRPFKQSDDNDERPRILVADDDREIRRVIGFILRSEFDATIVENGEKAIEKVRQGIEYDVVSLDLQMPGRSGVETLKEIKQLNPALEVLIMTAHSDVESAKKALKWGAYDYIDKPFKNETYRETIRKGVERRQKTLTAENAIEQLEFVKVQLKESEKFVAIGQLLAGIAHDLNNSLNSVIGFSDLLMTGDSPPEETRKYIENINSGAKLSVKTVQKLLGFTRRQNPEKVPVSINEIIISTLDLKQHDFKVDQIEVTQQLADSMPYTLADFYEIQQVLLNIVTNAHHALKANNDIRMLTVASEFDEDAIRISFKDTGMGIPKENLQKIFEPLFTTKEKGVGTGLGLSVCYDIIKDHKGSIYVASDPGRGACFVIELPIVSLA